MTLDTALYIGEAGNFLNGSPLIPGVTVAPVPEAEAIASDQWSPIDAALPTEAAPPSVLDGGSFRQENLASGRPGLLSTTETGILDGGAP